MELFTPPSRSCNIHVFNQRENKRWCWWRGGLNAAVEWKKNEKLLQFRMRRIKMLCLYSFASQSTIWETRRMWNYRAHRDTDENGRTKLSPLKQLLSLLRCRLQSRKLLRITPNCHGTLWKKCAWFNRKSRTQKRKRGSGNQKVCKNFCFNKEKFSILLL